MNNKAYYAALEIIISNFTKLRSQGLSVARSLFEEKLSKEDLLFCSSLDRCLNLTDGIILMLKARNMTCAGAILRLQMDNCMRTYAAMIAEDQDKVMNCLIYGKPISKEKDINGHKMTDGYLKTELSKLESSFSRMYNQMCGYIHLSDTAFYQTVTDVENDGKITLQIGSELPEKENDLLIECAEAFYHYVLMHYNLLYQVIDSKNDT